MKKEITVTATFCDYCGKEITNRGIISNFSMDGEQRDFCKDASCYVAWEREKRKLNKTCSHCGKDLTNEKDVYVAWDKEMVTHYFCKNEICFEEWVKDKPKEKIKIN